MHDTESKHIVYWAIHVVLVCVVVYSRFDSAMISVAVLIAIFNNLGQRSATSVSAYSIFNRGFRHLLGDIQPEAIDRQLRGAVDSEQNMSEPAEQKFGGDKILNFPSKYINRPCPCGSGLKAKKCCAAQPKPRGNNNASSSRAKQDDTEYDFSQFEVLQ